MICNDQIQIHVSRTMQKHVLNIFNPDIGSRTFHVLIFNLIQMDITHFRSIKMEKATGFSGSIAERHIIPGKNIIFTHSQE